MSDQAAHFDSSGKSGPARRISMELVADGARVTALSMAGSRLVMTIEAELSTSRMTTADESRDAFVPPEPAGALPTPSVKFSEPPSAAGATDIEPATDGTRPEPPGAELKPVTGIGAKHVEPMREDADGARSDSQTKSAEPVAVGPDIPEQNPALAESGGEHAGEPAGECAPPHHTTPEVDVPDRLLPDPGPTATPPPSSSLSDETIRNSSTGSEPVREAPSEAAEPEIEAVPAPETEPFAHGVSASGNAFDSEMAVPSFDSGRRDGAKPAETPESDEPRGFPDWRNPSGILIPGSPDRSEPATPKPPTHAWNEAKSLSFESAMDAADREKGMVKPQSDDPVKPAGRIISFAPAVHDEPAGLPNTGHGARSDAFESPVRETVPPAPAPLAPHPEPPESSLPQPAPLPRPEPPAIHLPQPPAHGDPTHPEECNTIGGDRHGEPQPSMSFGFEDPEPPEQTEPKASSRTPDQPDQSKPEAPEPRTGSTTVLIRYTCPRCKTQGMQAVDKVGTVVNCSNCGKAMRLVMKK